MTMTLKEAVEKYQSLAAGAFGKPVALSAFGLMPAETERIFGQFDEDYHISRYFHFTLDPARENLPGQTYQINAFPQSHVSLDAEITGIL
jgi:hypothetical protein